MRQELTVKQATFVSNITNWRNKTTFGNGTQSAKFAGYSGNENTLGVTAFYNLRNPKISAAIKRRMKKILSSDEVLQELSDIASADWKDFVEVRYGKNGEIVDASLKLGDKIKALELTGKYHKLFTDKVETSSDNTETKLHISSEIQSLAEDLGKSEAEIELEMQLRFANKLRKSYDPSLDPTVHPEVWKSGNLLRDKEIEAESESVS